METGIFDVIDGLETFRRAEAGKHRSRHLTGVRQGLEEIHTGTFTLPRVQVDQGHGGVSAAPSDLHRTHRGL